MSFEDRVQKDPRVLINLNSVVKLEGQVSILVEDAEAVSTIVGADQLAKIFTLGFEKGAGNTIPRRVGVIQNVFKDIHGRDIDRVISEPGIGTWSSKAHGELNGTILIRVDGAALDE